MILVIGSANIDFVTQAPDIPRAGETVLGRSLTLFPGGKGANQAVACAKAGKVEAAAATAEPAKRVRRFISVSFCLKIKLLFFCNH